MKKSIAVLLVMTLLLCPVMTASAAAAQGSMITVEYAIPNPSSPQHFSQWEHSSVHGDQDFAHEHYLSLSPGAALWQGISIGEQADQPQAGDIVHAKVYFRLHGNVTNNDNVLIRLVAGDKKLSEITSLSTVTRGVPAQLTTSINEANGQIPAGSDKLWVELHNDTDGIIEISSIELWGERDGAPAVYAAPNADFKQSFAGNWEYSGGISLQEALVTSAGPGVAAWTPLAVSNASDAPHAGDIVSVQASLFIPAEVSATNHVYFRLSDNSAELFEINNIDNLPRNQWVTVTGAAKSNQGTIHEGSSQLWMTIYNDSSYPIRMKDVRVTAQRTATSLFDLNGDQEINHEDLAWLIQQVETGQYDSSIDFDSDGQLTDKDIVFFRKYGLHEPNAFYLNLDHFQFMNEEVTIGQTPMLITHLYSEPIDRSDLSKGYAWVGDPQEGFAAVDDVARAVTAYAEHYRLYQDNASYDKMKLGLAFLMWMQHEDGDYDNFVVRDEDGTIHKKSSYSSNKSFSWWAVRAYEAMAVAYPLLRPSEDGALLSQLDERLALNLQRLIQKTMPRYGQNSSIDGMQVADWMLGKDSWQTAAVIIALFEHNKIADDTTKAVIADTVTKLGEALAKTQLGNFESFPYGGFMHIYDGLSTSVNWDEWGSVAIKAMAYAGQLSGNPAWIANAELAADSFLGDLMISGRAETIRPNKKSYPLINYGTSSLVDNYLALYEVTGKENYAKLAGIAASWWTGNNIRHTAMFNQEKGYAYDGMTADEVNINSGGESLDEAIRTLARVLANPVASSYLYVKTVKQSGALTIEAENLYRAAASPDVRMPLPYGDLNSADDALVLQSPASGTNEEAIYYDALNVGSTEELYNSWYGHHALYVAASGYNNMRLFNSSELTTTIPAGQAGDQFQAGDFVKLDFAARVEFDTELTAEVYALDADNQTTLIANAANMNFHARTWYAGVNSVKTTPLAPIPSGTTGLKIVFHVTSAKTPIYEGYAMVTEAKLFKMGVTEIRYGNTDFSGSSYIEMLPEASRCFTIHVPKTGKYDVVLSYQSNNDSAISMQLDNQALSPIPLSSKDNGRVIVEKAGTVSLTEGDASLTLTNSSSSQSAFIDAITLYPHQTYANYERTDGTIIQLKRNAETKTTTLGPPSNDDDEEAEEPYKPVTPPDSSIGVKESDYVVTGEQLTAGTDGITPIIVPAQKQLLLLPIAALKSWHGQSISIQWDEIIVVLDSSDIEALLQGNQTAQYAAVGLQTINPSAELLLEPDTALAFGDFIRIELGYRMAGGSYIALPRLASGIELQFKLTAPLQWLGLYQRIDGHLAFYRAASYDTAAGVWSVSISESGEYALLQYLKAYKDVPSHHWAFDAVSELSARHIVKGRSSEQMGIASAVTQAEMLALLLRAFQLESSAEAVSTEVNLPWYAPYVEAALNQGLIADASQISPNQSMTRAEAIHLLIAALDNQLELPNVSADPNQALQSFKDEVQLSEQHRAAFAKAVELGLIQGDQRGMLKPQQAITRAEAAVILQRLLARIDETIINGIIKS